MSMLRLKWQTEINWLFGIKTGEPSFGFKAKPDAA